MNAAGYRYAASDQAFYIPAVLRHLDPALFPRDVLLIDAQARILVVDELLAWVVRLTHLSLPHLFLGLYLLSLLLLLQGALQMGARLYRTRWALVALAGALTLRHAIAKTGTNTLEGYFHPRQMAFALGLMAVAGFMERRDRLWMALLLCAAVFHPTTAVWFGAWLGVATWFARPEWRRAIALVVVASIAGAALALWRGPLAGRLIPMDAQWLAVIGDRDYLFPLSWPLNVWFTNLVAIPIILVCWRRRQRARLTVPRETPLVLGAMALVVIFSCWLPFNVLHVALAVQLQTSRIFWMLDVLATVYLVWAISEGAGAAGGALGRRAAVAAVAILALSTTRGVYSCFIEFRDRPIFAIDIQHKDWRDAMAWARTTDRGSGWLADPHHAALYGSSVRAAGHRDVLLEQLKDPAIAMYDRTVAMRVADRERALEALAWDTPDGARGLARRFGLDYLVIDRALDLPLAHRSGSLYIYRLQ